MSDAAGYRPIACTLHNRLEAACLRRQPVAITWRDPDGHDHSATVVPRDVRSHAGAEYLLADHDGETLEIRLDRLLRFGDLPFSGAATCE
jgi:transcriptional antiterminator Rof (Rho-off)